MTVSTTPAPIDPKDALLSDAAALQSMYAKFVQEERQLAEVGLASYARLLDEEDRSEEEKQRACDRG